MSVKRAVETCSTEVADDIMLHSKFGFKETLMTRMYLRKVAKYFRIMNSTSLEQDAVHNLLQVLLFFKRWHNNIQETVKNRTGNLKDHWKQFISKHTNKDLIRSIRGFIGLVTYIQLNYRDVEIVPRTTNQDDVENYFSLQRSRIAGGEVTVQQYFEVVNTNYVSVPLKRKTVSRKTEKRQEPRSIIHQNDNNNDYLEDDEVNKFHSQKDNQQLYRQVQQVFDYINVKSSSVIIGYGQRLKLTRRTVALEKVKKWDKNLKGKVAEVLTDEYMSSEESSIEDDSAVYVIKTIPWESSQLKKRKRKLDKAYEKSSGKRSKQRSVKRVRKDEIISLREKPDNCPKWACVRQNLDNTNNDENNED
ncbi:hypothetical protein OS493_034388 [Desmophyllum pertusum]|uniref:Uncharacterized protein n=1 Tax=Desmophyllum pertusum TaxID=174260 RepID=A0A9W9ZXJ8_9CNID|nr:hypothetical protein OS493_034388 [Desmophyllum pertusum]